MYTRKLKVFLLNYLMGKINIEMNYYYYYYYYYYYVCLFVFTLAQHLDWSAGTKETLKCGMVLEVK